ncbi:hypothetical protein [Streptomyces sp. NPDC055085]
MFDEFFSDEKKVSAQPDPSSRAPFTIDNANKNTLIQRNEIVRKFVERDSPRGAPVWFAVGALVERGRFVENIVVLSKSAQFDDILPTVGVVLAPGIAQLSPDGSFTLTTPSSGMKPGAYTLSADGPTAKKAMMAMFAAMGSKKRIETKEAPSASSVFSGIPDSLDGATRDPRYWNVVLRYFNGPADVAENVLWVSACEEFPLDDPVLPRSGGAASALDSPIASDERWARFQKMIKSGDYNLAAEDISAMQEAVSSESEAVKSLHEAVQASNRDRIRELEVRIAELRRQFLAAVTVSRDSVWATLKEVYRIQLGTLTAEDWQKI